MTGECAVWNNSAADVERVLGTFFSAHNNPTRSRASNDDGCNSRPWRSPRAAATCVHFSLKQRLPSGRRYFALYFGIERSVRIRARSDSCRCSRI